ncbi:MAG: glycosyltransferase [Actinomycetota bacterium]|nr:glycosyltransferase [Actinomycetota bacterium]
MQRVKLLAVMDHLGGGGAEKQFLELVKRLDKSIFDIEVFLTEGAGKRMEEALQCGLKITCTTAKRNTLKALPALINSMRKFEPDVVMAWLSYSITLAAAAAALTGQKRLVFSERNSMEMLFTEEVRFGAIKKFIFKKCLSRAALVVTNSGIVAREFSDLGYAPGSKLKVVRNGIDLETLAHLPAKEALREKLVIPGDGLCGVYVGKLEQRKGLAYLMEALDGINNPSKQFRILGIGTGSMEETLRRHGRIELLGYKPNSIEYIKAADFLLLPSLYEGLPNVVLEALAVGTPVIASRVSGIPEIIEDGVDGLLVGPADAIALRAAMTRFLEDGGLRAKFAANGLKKIREFAMDKMVSSFAQLLLEAASRSPQP